MAIRKVTEFKLWNNFILALSFLTAFPLPKKGHNASQLSRAIPFFTLIGLLIGALLSGILYILHFYLPNNINLFIAVILIFVFTRGLHIDGLADSIDGLVGTTDREQALSIMEDEKVGAFGLSAVIFDIILKYLLLLSINPGFIWVALILFPAMARMCAVTALTFFPAAKNSGLGQELKKNSRKSSFFINLFILSWAFVLALSYSGLLILLAGLVAGMFITYLLSIKVRGITGDILGAVIELSEISILFIFVVIIK